VPIQVGDRLPEGDFTVMGQEGPERLSVSEFAAGRRVALFSVPGAFTPTCSAKHLPGFVALADALKAKGVDEILCMAVNDVFVLAAWGASSGADGKVRMLADGNGDYTRALGLELDERKYNMGIRGQRFSMLVEDGVVRRLNIDAPGQFGQSSAETLLEQLAS
jgi:peroxiredoxin